MMTLLKALMTGIITNYCVWYAQRATLKAEKKLKKLQEQQEEQHGS